MVDDRLAVDLTGARAPWIYEAAFAALLLLAFVGLSPFAIHAPAVTQFGENGTTGSGDALRQVCYLLVFCVIVTGAVRKQGWNAVRLMPVLLALLLLWCVASALWADVPMVALRRAGLAVILAVIAMLGVGTVGTARALVLWRWVLVLVLAVNWLSIPVLPQAKHLPGEVDPGLVGDWRGLYGHKNIAGAVCAMTIILFLFTMRARRRWFDIAVIAGALGFLLMTRSKSSMGLLPIALLLGGLYRLAWRRSLDRTIAVVAGLLVALVIAIFVLDHAGAISRALEDPDEFTGRSAIWQAEIAYIRDHPLLGSGFGTFADTGAASPLRNYVADKWVATVSHGHSGYLQLLVTVGGVGFVLAMLALIAEPLRDFWSNRGDIATRALLFSLFVFLVLHNFMESDFLEGDGVTWVAYLLMIAMLRDIRAER